MKNIIRASSLLMILLCGTAYAASSINNPQTNASALTTGTVAAARGGAGTISGALTANGSGVVTQAACANLSNGATGCSTTVGTSATVNTGNSGATIPLLNGTNTWQAVNSFNGATNSVAAFFSSNMGATFPSANSGLGIGNNFSGGNNEIDFFNTITGATTAFRWYQQTGASAATKLLELGTSGAVLMPALSSSSAAQTGTLCWTTGTGNITVDTTTTCLLSLEELKDKHGPITGALGEISKLEPFWYTWKQDTPEWAGDTHEQPGLGAHQVESVDPRLVGYDPSGKLHGVRYAQMVALLVASIKELKAENEEIRIEIASLRARPLHRHSKM